MVEPQIGTVSVVDALLEREGQGIRMDLLRADVDCLEPRNWLVDQLAELPHELIEAFERSYQSVPRFDVFAGKQIVRAVSDVEALSVAQHRMVSGIEERKELLDFHLLGVRIEEMAGLIGNVVVEGNEVLERFADDRKIDTRSSEPLMQSVAGM